MKVPATIVQIVFMVTSLQAQDFWLDVGYGAAPAFNSSYASGFRGFHLALTANNPWGDVVLHFSRRATFVESPYYYAGATGSSSTFSVNYGGTWETNRLRFGVSAGVGVFRGRFKEWGYPEYPSFIPVPRDRNQDVITIPTDMRICWGLSGNVGLGASVSWTYVRDNSYVEGSVFIRFGTR